MTIETHSERLTAADKALRAAVYASCPNWCNAVIHDEGGFHEHHTYLERHKGFSTGVTQRLDPLGAVFEPPIITLEIDTVPGDDLAVDGEDLGIIAGMLQRAAHQLDSLDCAGKLMAKV